MYRPGSAPANNAHQNRTVHYPATASATTRPKATASTLTSVPTIHASPLTKLGVGDRGQALVGPGRQAQNFRLPDIFALLIIDVV